MSGGKFLLDTNIITSWLKGEKEIADHIEKASDVYIPIIVLGELYYGAEYSTQVQKNIAVVRKLSSQYKVLLIDKAVTIEYGKVKAALRVKGAPIPENDIWIAAIALSNNLPLVTRDKHFNEVGGLKFKAW
ncbi:MAG: type II toxin-antitoxin system VapC family toxin [Cyclobacteriaceae bacterium]|nr:type II toxin-antitoxin system VapC family toxin [Cyclobacteriaceae bacterium]